VVDKATFWFRQVIDDLFPIIATRRSIDQPNCDFRRYAVRLPGGPTDGVDPTPLRHQRTHHISESWKFDKMLTEADVTQVARLVWRRCNTLEECIMSAGENFPMPNVRRAPTHQ
jgi:hypothetical protein